MIQFTYHDRQINGLGCLPVSLSMCHVSTVKDKEPLSPSQTLWTWVLPSYARESTSPRAGENRLPFGFFCEILKQHQAPCFWA